MVRITTKQLTNAFYLQSPRLQNSPILVLPQCASLHTQDRNVIITACQRKYVSFKMRGHSVRSCGMPEGTLGKLVAELENCPETAHGTKHTSLVSSPVAKQ